MQIYSRLWGIVIESFHVYNIYNDIVIVDTEMHELLPQTDLVDRDIFIQVLDYFGNISCHWSTLNSNVSY